MRNRAKKKDDQHAFGGAWTEWKLDAVTNYIRAYLRITGDKRLTLWYVDVFAGCGSRTDPDERSTRIYEGSAHIALDFPFDRFLFAERNVERAATLRGLAADHGKSAVTQVIAGDGLTALADWCAEHKFRPTTRAIVFLDPYAMSVSWEQLRALSTMPGVDLWLLVPVAAMLRNLPSDRIAISPTHAATMDRFYGTSQWRERFYFMSDGMMQQTLFDVEKAHVERTATAVTIAQYYRERLLELFPGRVSSHMRWLVNSQKSPLFALMFAMSNPDERAWRPGLRVANAILAKESDR